MPAKDIRVQDRGTFFDDSFFRDSWEDFDKAIQNVLDRFDGHGMRVDSQNRPQCRDMYHQIRSNKIDDDMYASQAIQLTEKDGRFQVVMDVRDFNPRDLQVKVIDERIVLEGRYDKVSEDGKSSSSKAFYREFMLPVEADIDQISTALSKDGVLTIRAPRKEGTALPSTANKSMASQFLQNTLNEHRYGNGTAPFKSNKQYAQSTSSYDSLDGFDSLPRDIKERLVFSDKDSGRSTCSGSPTPSGFSNIPSCASPAPSEACSEASRISASEFDIGKKTPFQKSEVAFQVKAPINTPPPSSGPAYPPAEGVQFPGGFHQPGQPPMNVSRMQPPSRPAAAVGSGGTASISVKEEDGKRTLTSETSSLVQQKDGFLESKEVAAEVTAKDSQAARREAVTRMMKTNEDPEGRYRKSEAADASDVSESCVQRLPDGSVVTVKKSSTSSSNFKQSFSSGVPQQGLFEPDFPAGFGDMHGFMGRGQSLMSQMSTDSLASNMSNMSNFSDMSNFSRFSDMSNFSDMSAGFPNRHPFQERFNFPDLPNRPGFSNFPGMPQTQQHMTNVQNTSRTYSTTSESSDPAFQHMKFQ